jgi:ferredoxin
LVIEAQRWAQTVRDMPRGKVLFAEPTGVTQRSRLWFEECEKEVLLDRWEAQLQKEALELREGERVTDVTGVLDGFEVVTDKGRYRARRVVLALGKAGNPRKADVPGERDAGARVLHRLDDPAHYAGREVFIYGGGDVACEAALALAPQSRVTLCTIDRELTYPKKRNREAIEAAAAAGHVTLKRGTRLSAITGDGVEVVGPAGRESLRADTVFEMIGAELPRPFFKKLGLRLEGEWSVARYAALAASFVLVYLLYAWKKGFPLDPARDIYRPEQASFPFDLLYPRLSRDLVVNLVRPLGLDPSFWYSLAYTIVMVIFGVAAMRRWRTRHQHLRYASLLFFQVVFFLIVNLAAPRLAGTDAWRAWGLYQPWPLFFNTFYWLPPGAVGWFFAGFGVFLVVVFMPLMARYHGKRFCTWICGCGGLAETLGDRVRHLTPKGPRSRAWELQNLVLLGWAVAALFATFTAFRGDPWNPISRLYSQIVDFWLVAVIPIALYPFYGGKVWCRYWCPLAAYNQVLSRWFGKLKIASNDKCISCTECSRYCQVGVDVMSFAKNQQPFDNTNSSCIHCGICIDVCPMGVLSFTSSDGKVHLGQAR